MAVKKEEIEGIKVNKAGKEYVNNAALLQEFVKSKAQGSLTDEAIQMFMVMVENIQRKLYYKDSDDKQDCFQSALLDVLQYWDRFDPDKSNNPFGFFTSVIVNGNAKGWDKLHPENKEKKKGNDIVFTSLDNNIFSF